MESLPQRVVALGDLSVRRLLPVRERRLIGPFCFLDRFGPLEFTNAKPMDVAPHPHIGLQTVTWLFSGEIVHRDSLDSECLVQPGRLSLMTAGRGIAHTEETPASHTGHLDGVQLWVALPDASRAIDPLYQCTPEQPRRELPGGVITSLLGNLLGAASAGRQFSPGIAAELAIHARAELTLPLDPVYEYGLLLVGGDAAAHGEELVRDTLYYLGSATGELAISSRTGARLILLGGPPFGETILMWWNFVARTSEEIAQAREAWERHEFFGDVTRYAGPRLPAPPFHARPVPSPRT